MSRPRPAARRRATAGAGRAAATAVVVLLGACSGEQRDAAGPAPSPSASPSATAVPTTPAATPSATTAAPAPTYGGQGVRWPRVRRTTSPPPALGAVRTLARVRTSGGGTLRAGLLLPRTGGTAARPRVLTPCGRTTTVTGRLQPVRASGAGDRLVLLDPGHGGTADGTRSPDGTVEKGLVLDIARRTAPLLRTRVVLTRQADHDAALPFRVGLADALRADLSLSIHLNAEPEVELPVPGTTTFASLADPEGRRAAGVVYESLRRFLEPLGPRVGGTWAADRDSGALYRRGSNGRDYYGLLRRAHTTWVIGEPLYLSDPEQAALAKDPAVRQGLAAAYADAAHRFLAGAPGSGWRTPIARPADPAPPPGQGGCREPA